MDSYNVNRKVATFGDFSNNIESEKEELKKVRRSTVPNTDDQQQHIGNGRYKFNKVTRKMDDLSPAEVQDKLDSIDELEETNPPESFDNRYEVDTIEFNKWNDLDWKLNAVGDIWYEYDFDFATKALNDLAEEINKFEL